MPFSVEFINNDLHNSIQATCFVQYLKATAQDQQNSDDLYYADISVAEKQCLHRCSDPAIDRQSGIAFNKGKRAGDNASVLVKPIGTGRNYEGQNAHKKHDTDQYGADGQKTLETEFYFFIKLFILQLYDLLLCEV